MFNMPSWSLCVEVDFPTHHEVWDECWRLSSLFKYPSVWQQLRKSSTAVQIHEHYNGEQDIILQDTGPLLRGCNSKVLG